KRSSSEREPRTLVATSAPIEVSAMLTIVSAISASIKVKPAWLELAVRGRHNFNASREPVDSHLIPKRRALQRDDTATGHSRCEETNVRLAFVLLTASGKMGFHVDVARDFDDPAGCTRTHNTRGGVYLSCDGQAAT